MTHYQNRASLESILTQSRSLNSVNVFSEDFIAGYMHDGRMSVVRRFFCLFVTFDLIFISLLWIITIMVCFFVLLINQNMYISDNTYLTKIDNWR